MCPKLGYVYLFVTDTWKSTTITTEPHNKIFEDNLFLMAP